MKYSSVLLFFLFTYINVFSQKQTYIITTKGDTVWAEYVGIKNGLIVVKNNDQHSAFYADSVLKVKTGGKESLVLHCVLQTFSDDVMGLPLGTTGQYPSIDTVILLAEVLNTPKMNLYTANDKMKATYYFYKTPLDIRPLQLVVRYYMGGGLASYDNNPAANRGDKSRLHIEEMKGYVNQLRTVMAGCNKIPDGMWDVLTYRDFSFKQLIKRYNQCK